MTLPGNGDRLAGVRLMLERLTDAVSVVGCLATAFCWGYWRAAGVGDKPTWERILVGVLAWAAFLVLWSLGR